ncbi:hypothetical protein QRQ56_30670 [Bradyrhizobium sp. U531]
MLSEEELKSLLRELEIDNYDEVRLCTFEGDGRLSVLKRQKYFVVTLATTIERTKNLQNKLS